MTCHLRRRQPGSGGHSGGRFGKRGSPGQRSHWGPPGRRPAAGDPSHGHDTTKGGTSRVPPPGRAAAGRWTAPVDRAAAAARR